MQAGLKSYTVDFADIMAAAARLRGHSKKTPLIRSDVIDIMCGATVWFKPECQQKVGAFKYRGAYNRLASLSKKDKKQGVVAFSSGNHAQGVARAARELGISSIIVMPKDAPSVKVAGVVADGSEIIFYDRRRESREDIAAQIARRDGRIIVPSFDDPYIIAGQGTVGIEVVKEARQKGLHFDALITPVGGGGLCAGISLALAELSPETKIFGAEPCFYNDHQLSLRSGKREALNDPPPTLCDALMTPRPGALTFPINQDHLRAVLTATDRDCLLAMALLWRELGVRTEPGGAVAFAALLGGRLKPDKNWQDRNIKNICIVLSGGNVDKTVFEQALAIL